MGNILTFSGVTSIIPDKILTYSIPTVIQSIDTVPSFSGDTYSGHFLGGYGYANPTFFLNTTPSDIAPTWYLSTPYTSDFNLSATDFYIQADFNVTNFDNIAVSGMNIITKDRYGSNWDWNVTVKDNSTIFLWSQASVAKMEITVPTMSTGVWYNVKVEHVAGINTLYLDGISYGSSAFTITNSSQNYITVGCSSWNNPGGFFNGYIDNVIIYNANTGSNVLDLDFENLDSSKQFFTDNTGKILTIHPTPQPRFIVGYNDIVREGLIVHYDMVNIHSYDRTGTTVNDLTGNGHTGTLVGGTSFTSDGGISFNGIDGALTYLLDIPSAMTHVIVAKSNQPTWSNYNGLGCNRGINGFSTHPWQGTSDNFSMGVNGDLGEGNGIGNYFSVSNFNPQSLHVYSITTDGTNATSYVDKIEYPIVSTTTRAISSTGSTIHIANDESPYSDRFTDVTVYAHLIYNRPLTQTEVIQNYNAFKNYA